MNSPIKWVGGKKKLLKHLLPLIPEHEGYVEVFGGAGWLLFAKERSKWEVLNDLDKNLFNFWNVVKEHKDEFIQSFEFEIISRAQFDMYKDTYINKTYSNKIQQAHILYYILKAGYAARLPDGGGASFGIAKEKSRLVLDNIFDDITSAHQRLKEVTIEARDFRKIVKSFDSKSTFFYFDPPYRGSAHDYPVGFFSDQDYKDLANACKLIEGKFILSINNDLFIRQLFEEFNIREVGIHYSPGDSQSRSNESCELIITNY